MNQKSPGALPGPLGITSFYMNHLPVDHATTGWTRAYGSDLYLGVASYLL